MLGFFYVFLLVERFFSSVRFFWLLIILFYIYSKQSCISRELSCTNSKLANNNEFCGVELSRPRDPTYSSSFKKAHQR